MIREAVEDIQRARSDVKQNSQSVEKTIWAGDRMSQCQAEWQEVQSSEITVGSLIKLHDNQMVPADVILIESKSKDCFIQTSSLDGEKTLKKKVHPKLFDCLDEVEVERPNANLHSFSGILKFKNG